MLTNPLPIVTLLQQLVAFPSVTPASAGSLEFIAELMQAAGGSCQWLKRNETSNLLVTLGQGPVSLAFAGHVDVVPPGEASRWENAEPFRLLVDGDRLVGRGVADMKGAIAAFMVAVQQFVAGRDPASYQIVLALTSDEEGSAIDGTPLIVEYMQQQGMRFNYCVVGEPSCVDHLGDTIKVGRRGSLTGQLIINGQQGHIAYPHLCRNPIHDFAPALAELTSKVWDDGNAYFPATSFQMANLNAGLGVTNVIPGQLSTNFNFRYNNLHRANDLQQLVTKILDKHQLNYQLTWQHSAQPFLTEVGRLVEVASTAIAQVCQRQPAAKTDGGTSDGRFLIAVCDEIIEFGLKNASIHQINESTTCSDLEKLTAVYLQILQQLFAANE